MAKEIVATRAMRRNYGDGRCFVGRKKDSLVKNRGVFVGEIRIWMHFDQPLGQQ